MQIQRLIRFSGALVFLSLLLVPGRGYGAQDLVDMQDNPGQWVLPGKDYALTRHSELSQITKDNVKNLKASWTFSTGVLRGHEGAPLVVGTTMYVVTPFPNIVYALDLTKPGPAIKWKYAPEQDEAAIPVACCDVVNRGVAYADGKIFLISSTPIPLLWMPKPARSCGKSNRAISARAKQSLWSRW